MFILYLCTQLCNEFLVTFYTPRNSSASGPEFGKTLIYWTHVDSSLIGERIKATLVPKETSVSLLHFHT